MQIQQNISLKLFNTFGIDVASRYFAAFSNTEELAELLLSVSKAPLFILGGGSNILFTKNYDGWVLKNNIMGIELIKEDEHHLYVKVGAGENWHGFVTYCIQRNWAGVENLSLIPGNVGASPMQNIGAYGVEVKEVFDELDAFHLKDNKVYKLSVNDCKFGYRDSIFKNKYKGQFVILNVTFRLNKIPRYNISYEALERELEKKGIKKLSMKAISEAVIDIRMAKLPDPAKIGNAGSYFKNPQISKSKYESLKDKYPELTGYESGDGKVKLPAAWLIEQCGWKGFRKGDAGCHDKQALVLVNYGKATGKDIEQLAEKILQSVKHKFGIQLEKEVNIV